MNHIKMLFQIGFIYLREKCDHVTKGQHREHRTGSGIRTITSLVYATTVETLAGEV